MNDNMDTREKSEEAKEEAAIMEKVKFLNGHFCNDRSPGNTERWTYKQLSH